VDVITEAEAEAEAEAGNRKPEEKGRRRNDSAGKY